MQNLALLTLLSALSAPLQARRPDNSQASLGSASADYSTCPQDPVCPSKWDTGLRYGHCYTLASVNGDEPMCRTADEAYMTGSRTCNLIFRASIYVTARSIDTLMAEQLCKQADDCDADAGAWIANNGSWYLQDQIGRVDGTSANANRPIPGIATTPDSWLRLRDHTPSEAKKASALQVSFAQCMFGGCAHCIRYADGSGAKVGMRNVEEHKDWGTHKLFPGPAENPLNCLAFRFREVLCVPGVPARPVKV